jgi:hypothetical protein
MLLLLLLLLLLLWGLVTVGAIQAHPPFSRLPMQRAAGLARQPRMSLVKQKCPNAASFDYARAQFMHLLQQQNQ